MTFTLADDDLGAIKPLVITPPPAGWHPVMHGSQRKTNQDGNADPVGTHRENCRKCGGTGTYRGYSSYGSDCFECKGKGYKVFKHDAATRAKNRENTAARKVKRAQEAVALYATTNPEQHKWLTEAAARGFGFASSLLEALGKYGELTENQEAAVARCMAKDAARAEQRAKVEAEKPAAAECDASKAQEAMLRAKASGLKYVGLDLGQFALRLAPDTGKNPGAIYVTLGAGRNQPYMGKVMQGKFLRGRDCTDALQAEFLALVADPLAAARAHGKQTGRCACCGRELTDPVSVANGIGPICEGRYWGG